MTQILCLSIDGWHAGMTGAFGNSWIETPTLDRLAFESAVFDRYYTDSLDLADIFTALWTPVLSNKNHRRCLLVTDETQATEHPLATQFDELFHFDEPLELKHPVMRVENTQFVRAIDALVSILETERTTHPDLFVWCHLKGFRGFWDFPMKYRNKYKDEDDPVPYSDVAIPQFRQSEFDHDFMQSVLEAYCGGITVFDDVLAALLDTLSSQSSETLFALLATRGFSLGEHHTIGTDDAIYAESVHLPLFLRFPGGQWQATRSSALIQPADVGAFFADGQPLRQLLETEREHHRDHLLIRNSNGERAVMTPDWFLKTVPNHPAERVELYVKPDDRWEVNDVSVRCPETVEQLLPLCRGDDSL